MSLRWTARTDLAIDGFQLYRRTATDSTFQPLGTLLLPSSNSFLDAGIPNGRDYRYRLYYVIGGQLSTLPAEDIATPGPLRPWVCDPGTAELLQLSADGRDIVSRHRIGITPYSITVSPIEGQLWVSELSSDLVPPSRARLGTSRTTR